VSLPGLSCATAPRVGKECVLDTVYFEYDRSDLTAPARKLLERSAECMRARPGVAVAIEAHTDNRGTEEYNIALTLRQAQAVKKFLVNLGIAEDRLRVSSYGESRPVCSEQTAECRAKNRRVELHFAD